MPYTPTQQEKEKCQKLLSNLTIPWSSYQRYIDYVEAFLEAYEKSLTAQPSVNKKFVQYKSIVFGKSYLIAYVEDEWIKQMGSTLDAFAAQRWKFMTIAFPPLVFVPYSWMNLNSEKHISIIEHEIVHLNQFLIRKIPSFADNTIEVLKKEFLHTMRSEYEAYFIQLANYPLLYPEEKGFSLEEWCILRAYTQYLDRMLFWGALSRIPTENIISLLEWLKAELPKKFDYLGFEKTAGKKYSNQLADMVLTGISHIFKDYPQTQVNKSYYLAIRDWILKQGDEFEEYLCQKNSD